jgi:hypothetical protein
VSIHKLGCGDGGKWYPTDAKEDKPMENRTKLEELLNIQRGEQFTLNDRDGRFYLYNGVTLCDAGNNSICDCALLGSILCGLVKVIRLPHYTPEQVETMRLLLDIGYKWLGKNEDGKITAYEKRPGMGMHCWYNPSGKGYMFGTTVDTLAGIVKDWTVPLDLLAALRDAGEVAEG